MSEELIAAKQALRKALDSELRVAARLDEMLGAIKGLLIASTSADVAYARKRAAEVIDNASVAIRASHLYPLVLCAREIAKGDGSATNLDQARRYARAGLVWTGVE